jgi:SAM-dependent methyltransferase
MPEWIRLCAHFLVSRTRIITTRVREAFALLLKGKEGDSATGGGPDLVPAKSTPDEVYGAGFYEDQQDGSMRSAGVILPLVFDLVQPKSVADVGCGIGGWLEVALKLGVADVTGIDGDWVPRDALKIPPERFLAMDLSAPLRLSRRFDLVICMEVAEHLDPTRADSLVADLCALSDVVLFSAAIPGQTGSRHRNEQWPPYWYARFEQQGHEIVDCLRPRLWTDDRIEPWYAQNAVLYVNRDHLAGDERVRAAWAEPARMPLSAVHPEVFALFSRPSAPPDPEPPERRPAPYTFESLSPD